MSLREIPVPAINFVAALEFLVVFGDYGSDNSRSDWEKYDKYGARKRPPRRYDYVKITFIYLVFCLYGANVNLVFKNFSEFYKL